MATQALTADAAVADGTTYVSSALAYQVTAFLASDFDADDVVRFEASANGSIQVCDSDGARIGIVPAESSAVAVLEDSGSWKFYPLTRAPATLVADGSDAATTQTLANALKAILVGMGYMKAE